MRHNPRKRKADRSAGKVFSSSAKGCAFQSHRERRSSAESPLFRGLSAFCFIVPGKRPGEKDGAKYGTLSQNPAKSGEAREIAVCLKWYICTSGDRIVQNSRQNRKLPIAPKGRIGSFFMYKAVPLKARSAECCFPPRYRRHTACRRIRRPKSMQEAPANEPLRYPHAAGGCIRC